MENHMRYHLILWLFSLTALADLHAETFKIETINYHFTDSSPFEHELKLPFVAGSWTNVARKINDYLFIDILQTLAPANAKNRVSRSLNKDSDYDPASGIASLEYEIKLNNGKLLTLATHGEYCGAYCEGSDNYYSFDATTGRHIVLEDIFTQQAIAELSKKLYQGRVQQIQGMIKSLKAKSDQKAKKQIKDNSSESEDLAETIGMYEECLSINSGEHELDHFLIEAKSITFWHWRCSNHAMLALDELGDFHHSYDFQELKPYLTGYGKALLLGAANAKNPDTVWGQVLYGTIGQYKITMKLESPADSSSPITGVYFYQKTRQPIKLSGSLDNLIEQGSESKIKPVISAKLQDGALTGEWRGDRHLKFQAGP